MTKVLDSFEIINDSQDAQATKEKNTKQKSPWRRKSIWSTVVAKSFQIACDELPHLPTRLAKLLPIIDPKTAMAMPLQYGNHNIGDRQTQNRF